MSEPFPVPQRMTIKIALRRTAATAVQAAAIAVLVVLAAVTSGQDWDDMGLVALGAFLVPVATCVQRVTQALLDQRRYGGSA